MTPTREEIVKLLREGADYAEHLASICQYDGHSRHEAGAGEAGSVSPEQDRYLERERVFRGAADALEAAEPKGTRLASARGKLGDLFVEAGEAGLDKSGTEDFVREGFGEWVERTLAETLTAAPMLTFEEKVERVANDKIVFDSFQSYRTGMEDHPDTATEKDVVANVLRAAGVEE